VKEACLNDIKARAFNTLHFPLKLQKYMHDQKDSWTLALVIFVSIVAVKIGVHNLEWGLKTASEVITQTEAHSNK
jgi:hypothetical protein